MKGGGNKWTDFVRDFASRNSISYMCALSNPDCKKEYRSKYGVTKPLSKKKEREQMGMEDFPAPDTKKKKLLISRAKLAKQKDAVEKAKEAKENITMSVEDFDVVPIREEAVADAKADKKKRGRPSKYSTEEEKKKAKSAKTVEAAKRRQQEKRETKAAARSEKAAVKAAKAAAKQNVTFTTSKPLTGGFDPACFLETGAAVCATSCAVALAYGSYRDWLDRRRRGRRVEHFPADVQVIFRQVPEAEVIFRNAAEAGLTSLPNAEEICAPEIAIPIERDPTGGHWTPQMLPHLAKELDNYKSIAHHLGIHLGEKGKKDPKDSAGFRHFSLEIKRLERLLNKVKK